jgi:hypothetical protein
MPLQTVKAQPSEDSQHEEQQQEERQQKECCIQRCAPIVLSQNH